MSADRTRRRPLRNRPCRRREVRRRHPAATAAHPTHQHVSSWPHGAVWSARRVVSAEDAGSNPAGVAQPKNLGACRTPKRQPVSPHPKSGCLQDRGGGAPGSTLRAAPTPHGSFTRHMHSPDPRQVPRLALVAQRIAHQFPVLGAPSSNLGEGTVTMVYRRPFGRVHTCLWNRRSGVSTRWSPQKHQP